MAEIPTALGSTGAGVGTDHASGSEASHRVLTAPNAISISRLGLLAWSLAELFGPDARVEAAILLAIAGSTDFLDGFVARRFGQVSELGKILDPLVDVVVLMSAIVAVAIYHAVPWWFARVVLAHETHMMVSAFVLRRLGARRVDVIYLGKCATFGLMTAFPLLLLGDGFGSAEHVFRIIGWVVGIPSLVLSVATVFIYAPIARAALVAGREDRSTTTASAT